MCQTYNVQYPLNEWSPFDNISQPTWKRASYCSCCTGEKGQAEKAVALPGHGMGGPSSLAGFREAE